MDEQHYKDVFFFSSRRRHTRSLCDWSSDVCSSDLKPFLDFTGDAETEIALDPGRNDARKAPFGFSSSRCAHQPDEWSFLPRIAHGEGCPRVNGKCDECGRPGRRDQDGPQHDNGSLFHAHLLIEIDVIHTL